MDPRDPQEQAGDDPTASYGDMGDGGQSLTQVALGGILVSSFGVGGQALLQVAVTATLARLVLPEEFGLVGAAMVFVAFSNLFVQAGIGPALVQRPDLERRHLETGMTLAVLLGLAVGILVFVSAPLAAEVFRMPDLTTILRVLSLGFVMQGPAVVASAITERQLRFRAIVVVRFLGYLIGYGVVGIGLALLGFGVWALVGASLTQIGTTAVLFLGLQSIRPRPGLQAAAARDLLSYGGGFTAGGVASYVAENVDNAVVGRALGPQALGYYGRAFQFLAMPSQMGTAAFERVFFPVLTKVQLDAERMRRAFRRSVAAISLATLPITVPLVILAPEIVRVLLGPGWEPVIRPFQILALVLPLRVGAKIAKSVAKATGAVNASAWRQAVFAALVLIGAWAGSYWGLVGVAAGVLASAAVNYALLADLGLSQASLSWGEFGLAHVPGAALALVWAALVLPVTYALRSWNVADVFVIASGASVALASVPVLWTAWPRMFLGRDGRWALDVLFSRLKARSAS